MTLQVPVSEDEKMAGLQRLSNRYHPSESPVVVKGKEDYKRYKLEEAFKDIETQSTDAASFEELIRHLTKKGQQIKKDTTYQLTPNEVAKINLLFQHTDIGNYGTVEM